MAARGTWQIVTGLLIFWLVILLYMSSTLYTTSDTSERTERNLAKALQELDALKQQNNELRQLAEELKDMKLFSAGASMQNGKEQLSDVERRLDEANQKLAELQLHGNTHHSANAVVSTNHSGAVTNEHEAIRRKIENGAVEFWYYMNSKLSRLKDQSQGNIGVVSYINDMLEDGIDHYRTIITDLYNLSQSSGTGDWRFHESKDLGDIVQRRLYHLQNPADCSTAQKVVCNLNKGCGYGCQLHHMVYCFIIAYGTERTLILESRGWRYSPSGWETFFKPLSETCTNRDGANSRSWGPPSVIDSVQVVELPIVDSLHPRPPFMPLAIPEDLAPRLTRLHGHPIVWWIGQFLKYMLRPQPDLQKDIDETKERLGFKSPIVGVHVRRTDKVGTEAAFHSMEEYMLHVDNFYEMLEKRQAVAQRRIYLATDDPNLLMEAKQKFHQYEIISDNDISKTAGLGSRYSESSLRGVIVDIHFLSLTDYLVCTFSSQVCRVAYEIMQQFHPDASRYFYSLDDIYYFGGQGAHNQEVVYEHHARDSSELDLQPGDLIGVAGNHWNGYSKGLNRRNGKTGLYPSYKVKDHLDIAEFPTYSEVDKKGKR